MNLPNILCDNLAELSQEMSLIEPLTANPSDFFYNKEMGYWCKGIQIYWRGICSDDGAIWSTSYFINKYVVKLMSHCLTNLRQEDAMT